MYKMCAKHIFKRKIYVRSKFTCVHSSHDLCVCVRTLAQLRGYIAYNQHIMKSYA